MFQVYERNNKKFFDLVFFWNFTIASDRLIIGSDVDDDNNDGDGDDGDGDDVDGSSSGSGSIPAVPQVFSLLKNFMTSA